MLVDPIQMVNDGGRRRGLRGCGCFSGHDAAAGYLARQGGRPLVGIAPASRGFRLVRTMYPPTSGHESTASRHAP
jgi:hypothetical protein